MSAVTTTCTELRIVIRNGVFCICGSPTGGDTGGGGGGVSFA